MIWWEDFKVGDAADLGQHAFSEDEIVAFARQFDPQSFDTDKIRWEAVNQRGELVLTMEVWGFLGRKD